MSTLKVDAISNVAGTGSPNITEQAKAWVNFNGTGTVAIRADYNVSSLTDLGTGNYTVSFTNAFADTNYAVVSSNVHEPSVAVWDIAYRTDTLQPTAVGVQSMSTTSTVPGDSPYLTVAIFR